MNAETEKLYNDALGAKSLYKQGKITRKEALTIMQPYINKFNEVSETLAKKYNQKPKKFSFNSFVR